MTQNYSKLCYLCKPLVVCNDDGIWYVICQGRQFWGIFSTSMATFIYFLILHSPRQTSILDLPRVECTNIQTKNMIIKYIL